MMESIQKLLGENLYGFLGFKATIGVWMCLAGLAGAMLCKALKG
jgi:hypothetical protein